jgi:hypothetical protein
VCVSGEEVVRGRRAHRATLPQLWGLRRPEELGVLDGCLKRRRRRRARQVLLLFHAGLRVVLGGEGLEGARVRLDDVEEAGLLVPLAVAEPHLCATRRVGLREGHIVPLSGCHGGGESPRSPTSPKAAVTTKPDFVSSYLRIFTRNLPPPELPTRVGVTIHDHKAIGSNPRTDTFCPRANRASLMPPRGLSAHLSALSTGCTSGGASAAASCTTRRA